MAQTIKLKRASGENSAGKVPTIAQLDLGEVAINTYDGRVFIKQSGSGDDENIRHVITTDSEITGSINLVGSNSKIGIGIAAPTTKLHISSSVSNAVRIETEGSANQQGPQLFIHGNKQDHAPSRTTIIELKGDDIARARGIEFTSTDNANKKWYAGTPYNTNGYTIGYASNGTDPEYLISSSLFIDDNRNVGIGITTLASAKLHISQSTTSPGLLVDGGKNGNLIAKFRRSEGISPSADGFVGIHLSDSDAQIRFEPAIETRRWSIGASNASPGNFVFATSSKIDGNEVAHINRKGGIYTTSVTASGNISASGDLSIQGFSSVSASLASLTAAGADDLGNHTATQDLDLANFNIKGITHITASGQISASGTGKHILGGDLFIRDAVNPSLFLTDTTNALSSRIYQANDSLFIDVDPDINIGGSPDQNLIIVTNLHQAPNSAGSAMFIDGGTGTIHFNSNSATIDTNGNVTANNLSGTNTGDQSLVHLAATSSVSGAFAAPSSSFSTRVTTLEGAGYLTASPFTAAGISGSWQGQNFLTTSPFTAAGISGSWQSQNFLTTSPFTAAGISGSFNTVSASLAADIPTNNNQLTNGAGYLTTVDISDNTNLLGGTNLTLSDDTMNLDANISLTSITASGAISASGNLFANLSEDSSNFNTVMYDTATGQFYYTGSYGSGGGGGGGGIFTSEGDYQTTTNNLKITGSVEISGSSLSLTSAAVGSGTDDGCKILFKRSGSQNTTTTSNELYKNTDFYIDHRLEASNRPVFGIGHGYKSSLWSEAITIASDSGFDNVEEVVGKGSVVGININSISALGNNYTLNVSGSTRIADGDFVVSSGSLVIYASASKEAFGTGISSQNRIEGLAERFLPWPGVSAGSSDPYYQPPSTSQVNTFTATDFDVNIFPYFYETVNYGNETREINIGQDYTGFLTLNSVDICGDFEASNEYLYIGVGGQYIGLIGGYGGYSTNNGDDVNQVHTEFMPFYPYPTPTTNLGLFYNTNPNVNEIYCENGIIQVTIQKPSTVGVSLNGGNSANTFNPIHPVIRVNLDVPSTSTVFNNDGTQGKGLIVGNTETPNNAAAHLFNICASGSQNTGLRITLGDGESSQINAGYGFSTEENGLGSNFIECWAPINGASPLMVGKAHAIDDTGVEWATVSDERLKENIIPYDKGLDFIKTLKVKEFNFIRDKNKTPTVGFIAQEFNESAPNLTHKGGSDSQSNPWSISTKPLIPYLVNAIQKQQEQIEQLQEEINRLKINKS